MSVDDLLQWVIQGFFLLVGALTVADLARHRDRARLDIALAFGSLGGVILVGLVEDLTGREVGWLSTFSALVLVAQPYLLLRLVGHFGPLPRLAHGLALVGLGLSWIVLLAVPSPLPTVAALPVVIYFAVVEGYTAVAFVRRALASRGVARRRLILAAAGTGLFGGIILVAGANLALPAITPLTTPLLRLGAVLAGVSYYLAFAPPRALRRAWQLGELYHFLRESAASPAAGQAAELLGSLQQAALHAVGGLSAAVAVWEADQKRLAFQDTGEGSRVSVPVAEEGVVGRAWRERRPAVARHPADFGPAGSRLALAADADVLYAVPIATARQGWGLLLVGKRGALFPDDDLELLALLAEQTATALENADLLARQQAMVGQLRDEVAERRRAEEEIRRLNQALERRAADLEEANRELEAFSYSVSHDLRAPLRAIDGFSRILLEDHLAQLAPEAQRYLKLVRVNAQQMGRLIDDLLDFSRLNRQPLKRLPLTPADLARRVLDDLRPDQEGRQVEIAIGDLPDCQADPALLKQVFANLLGNALKFTRQREAGRIEVGCQQIDGQDVYYVRDNGAGFDMRYADKLFGVFQRLHRAEDYEGTGVGLATVQRIVHRHGGRVWAEGQVDGGATFYFTLGGEAADERESG